MEIRNAAAATEILAMRILGPLLEYILGDLCVAMNQTLAVLGRSAILLLRDPPSLARASPALYGCGDNQTGS